MNRRNDSEIRLQNFLASMEAGIASASDREILETVSAKAEAAEVKAIVAKALARTKGPKLVKPTLAAVQPLTGKARLSSIPSDIDERIKLLKVLIASRPDVPTQFRAVFGGGRKPTVKEVDSLMAELIRLGMLRSKSE